MTERGSDKHGPRLDDEMEQEAEPLQRAGKEPHTEEERERESEEEPSPGPRLAGSGSSADDFPYRDRGEEGGASHPKP
jgi:hypothetical protein